jgi:hypothetical protein
VRGLVPEYIPNGVAILQYADDTILCMEDDEDTSQNMKLLLYIYEKMSGLKINFEKSEVLMISTDSEKTIKYSDMYNCAVGQWPIKYLEVPLAGSRLHIKDWMKLVERVLKKLDSWQCSSLSSGGKLVLLDACLSNTPTYAMSIYLLPKTVVKKIDGTRKRFFWQGGGTEKKYHLVKWCLIARPKNKGGLGVKDLRKMNLSLLCKWWWKLENEVGRVARISEKEIQN